MDAKRTSAAGLVLAPVYRPSGPTAECAGKVLDRLAEDLLAVRDEEDALELGAVAVEGAEPGLAEAGREDDEARALSTPPASLARPAVPPSESNVATESRVAALQPPLARGALWPAGRGTEQSIRLSAVRCWARQTMSRTLSQARANPRGRGTRARDSSIQFRVSARPR